MADQIPWMVKINTTTYFDLLVQSFKIVRKIESIIQSILANINYPRDNHIIVRIYQGIII